MAYVGKVKRPIASIGAVVIKADGTRVDLGTIAGEGRDDPANKKKGAEGRAKLNKLLKKEARHGG